MPCHRSEVIEAGPRARFMMQSLTITIGSAAPLAAPPSIHRWPTPSPVQPRRTQGGLRQRHTPPRQTAGEASYRMMLEADHERRDRSTRPAVPILTIRRESCRTAAATVDRLLLTPSFGITTVLTAASSGQLGADLGRRDGRPATPRLRPRPFLTQHVPDQLTCGQGAELSREGDLLSALATPGPLPRRTLRYRPGFWLGQGRTRHPVRKPRTW
jgi:hypothetical protein